MTKKPDKRKPDPKPKRDEDEQNDPNVQAKSMIDRIAEQTESVKKKSP